MYQYSLHQRVNHLLNTNGIDIKGLDDFFYARFMADVSTIYSLYKQIYQHHIKAETAFDEVLLTIILGYKNRSAQLKQKDIEKQAQGHWFLSNTIAGMSLYVDRFCGNLKGLGYKLGYLKDIGVNLVHVMPVFESPAGESDGGYAVSDYRKTDARFGTIDDLLGVLQNMRDQQMYIMLDIVLNHTSHKHAWALQAKEGDKKYQDFYYMYSNREMPDKFDAAMPEVFPESAPGNFTYIQQCNKWVMTVFHNYQWDLNYTNPDVFVAMLDTIFFYANLGVDILRIDAPAFIWKQVGTTCQNLPMAHTILQLIRQCINVAAPGMAILGEAIVAPKDIMEYFGTGPATAQECDVAYNATQMALQWDMLATGNTKVMLAAQNILLQKPYGTTWVTYTRCHDDIGLGYDDRMIAEAGYNPYQHRKFLKEYYSGLNGSPAMGALFAINPKTQDARISGTLASLCGLEAALKYDDEHNISLAIQKILLMQAHSFFIGGIPMLFYGDEAGYTNDYSYLHDSAKSYDNRWMHRPLINWLKNDKIFIDGTVEQRIFYGTKRLLYIRKALPEFGDYKNIVWLTPHNINVAGFIRQHEGQRVFCVFNFISNTAYLTWYAFKENGSIPLKLYDCWGDVYYTVGNDDEYLEIGPYCFCILQVV